jgi:hypothetical protein
LRKVHPLMTSVHRLLAARRNGGAPTHAAGPSKKEMAIQKATNEHRDNVDLYFSKLVESVLIEARGSVRVNRDVPTFNEAAHKWGLLRLDADDQVRREVLSNNQSAVLPGAIPKPPTEQQRLVYQRGYVIWYLCGRPKPKMEQSHAEGYLTELVQYTATIDNPKGSGAVRFKNSPVYLSQLNDCASKAYDHHLKSAPPPSRPVEMKRLLAQPASERVVVPKLGFVPQASVPLPLAMVADVGVQFLQTPEAHHTFRASNLDAIRQKVSNFISTDVVFKVSPVSPQDGGMRPCEYQFSNGLHANGEMLYHALRDQHDIDSLMPDVPESFRGLNLTLVASGSYNSVWRLARSFNGTEPLVPEALRALFPKHVIEGLVQDTLVLRIPSQWSSYNDVLLETVNMSEAVLGRYGPNIAAMWVGRESKQEMPGTGITQGRFKLFAILERGTDVYTRILNMTKQPHDIWERYFRSLRRCIWRFSANRCLHLDGKLANLIDTFPSDKQGNIVANFDDKTSTIKAIDLDSDFYRRVERLTQEESTSATLATSPQMAQGWKLVWLYNILFVTCSIRIALPAEVYNKLWWPPIAKAVKSILRECVSERSLPTKDAEYMRARSFLMNCKWAGGVLMAKAAKKPRIGNDPSALSETALSIVKYYFHDFWYKEAVKKLVEPARAVRLAKRNGADAARYEVLRQDRNQAWTWYNSTFRPRALPMIRFFSDKMQDEEHRALPMIQVLFDYSDASEEDLYPLTAGTRHPRKPTQIVTWPFARPVFDEQWLDLVTWEDPRTAAREIGFR